MKAKYEQEMKPLSRGGIPAAIAVPHRDQKRKWYNSKAAVPMLPCISTSEEKEEIKQQQRVDAQREFRGGTALSGVRLEGVTHRILTPG